MFFAVVTFRQVQYSQRLTKQGKTVERDIPKISFTLDPLPESKLAPLPGGNNRLTCNRMLRVKKLIAYIDSRVPPLPGQKTEILLDNNILSSDLTVATIKYFYHKNKGPLILYFCQSPIGTATTK